MSCKNVLLLSAGRRVALLQAFGEALQRRGKGGAMLAADVNPAMSAACALADAAFVLPRADHADYVEALRRLCGHAEVGLVVPTIDTELLALAQARQELHDDGVAVVVSDPAMVHLCRDKRRTFGFFREHGTETPALYRPDALQFPVFVKPVDGSNSAGLHLWRDPSAVSGAVLQDPRNLFMAFYDPERWQEYTVDAYYRQSGHLHCAVPRHRLQVRGGEVSKARTVCNALVEHLAVHMSHVPGLRGPVTLQFFGEGDRWVGSEINARFGGGYPLSHAAGVDYPGWLIDEYLYATPPPKPAWQDNMLMLRYDAAVFLAAEDA